MLVQKRNTLSDLNKNFAKIGQTVANVWRFNGFQNSGAAVTMLEFKLVQFLTAETVKGPILHHCAKFREDQSSCA